MTDRNRHKLPLSANIAGEVADNTSAFDSIVVAYDTRFKDVWLYSFDGGEESTASIVMVSPRDASKLAELLKIAVERLND